MESPIVTLEHLSPREPHEYALSHSSSWLKDFFAESFGAENLNLAVKLSLKRGHNQLLQDYVIAHVSLTGSCQRPCTRCLIPTEVSLKLQESCCFVHESEFPEEFDGETAIICEEKLYEIYPVEQSKINLLTWFAEIIALEVNMDPLHAEDCRGLCQNCGTNLNHGSCQCSKSKDSSTKPANPLAAALAKIKK